MIFIQSIDREVDSKMKEITDLHTAVRQKDDYCSHETDKHTDREAETDVKDDLLTVVQLEDLLHSWDSSQIYIYLDTYKDT